MRRVDPDAVLLDGAGHNAHWEDPAAVWSLCADSRRDRRSRASLSAESARDRRSRRRSVDDAEADAPGAGRLLRCPAVDRRLRLTGPATRADGRMPLVSVTGTCGIRRSSGSRATRTCPRVLAGDLRQRLAAVLLTAPHGAVVEPQDGRRPVATGDPARRPTTGAIAPHRSGVLACREQGGPPRPPDRHRRATRSLGTSPLSVTAPARTWRDLAAVLQPPALLAVTDQLLAGGCTSAALQEQLDRRPSGRGSRPGADGSAASLTVVAGSPMESVLRWLLHEAGVPHPTCSTSSGRLSPCSIAGPRLARPKGAGRVRRRRSTGIGGCFVEDLRRQNALVAAGWTVLRFSSADVLGRPDEVIAAILRAAPRLRSAISHGLAPQGVRDRRRRRGGRPGLRAERGRSGGRPVGSAAWHGWSSTSS